MRWVLVTAVAVWPLVSAVPAKSMRVTATVDPTSIVFPTTRTLTYRLTLQTGPAGAHVAVDLRQPTFGSGSRAEGSVVYPADEPHLEGPGSIDSRVGFQGPVACSPSGLRTAHGYESFNVRVELTIPPSSTTTLVAPYTTGLTAPWPSLDFRLHYTITPLTDSGHRDTSAPVTHRASPAPALRGPTGVQILLHSRPALPRMGRRGRGLRSGQSLTLTGATHPHLAGQHLTLRFVGPGHPHTLWPLGIVTERHDGRFGPLRWTPPQPGYYEIWAFYHSGSPKRTRSDYACPLTFIVR